MAIILAEIIEQARGLTGQRKSNSNADNVIADPEIKIALEVTIRDLNGQVGDATANIEKRLTLTANQQRYNLDTFLADANWGEITAVYRGGVGSTVQTMGSTSGLAVYGLSVFTQWPDFLLGQGTGTDQNGEIVQPVIPTGLQPAVFNAFDQFSQFERLDAQSWEIYGRDLILIPVPTTAEGVIIRYTTSTSTIDDLPDKARYALIFSACVALLDGLINRLANRVVNSDVAGQTVVQQMKNAMTQRDYYQNKLSGEMAAIST